MSSTVFYNPTRIVFGAKSIETLKNLPGNRNVLFVSTEGAKSRKFIDQTLQYLPADSIDFFYDVKSHPDMNELINTTSGLNLKKIDVIVALGGGSTIDTAKFIAYTNALPKHVNSKKDIVENLNSTLVGIPIIAIPTTAGSGSEVTPFATIWDRPLKLKHSIYSKSLFPYMAVIDCNFTTKLSTQQTLYGALDALSHAFESIWNINCNEITFQYSSNAVTLILNNLVECISDPENTELRNKLMKGALYAGLAISNTRTAIAHSISYPLTLNFGLPHGLACSFTLIELLKISLYQKKDYIPKLAHEAGFINDAALVDKLMEVFSLLNVKERTKDYIESSSIHSLRDDFLKNERAFNSFIELNIDQIQALILRALD